VYLPAECQNSPAAVAEEAFPGNEVCNIIVSGQAASTSIPSPSSRPASIVAKGHRPHGSWAQHDDLAPKSRMNPNVVDWACAGGHSHQGGCWRPWRSWHREIPRTLRIRVLESGQGCSPLCEPSEQSHGLSIADFRQPVHHRTSR